MKRNGYSMIATVIIPCVLICFLSIIAYYIPINSEFRVNFTID